MADKTVKKYECDYCHKIKKGTPLRNVEFEASMDRKDGKRLTVKLGIQVTYDPGWCEGLGEESPPYDLCPDCLRLAFQDLKVDGT